MSSTISADKFPVMGTTPSSTSALFAPQVFTGVSQFSSDFQSILQRAVSIAELPITALQNQQSDLVQQKQLLIGLNTAAASLGSSLGALGSLGANQGLSATSSDNSTVSVTNSGAISPATYTISKITSIASAAAETSVSGFADSTSAPVSATGIMKLVVGSNTYAINLAPGQNNLNGLTDAINKLGAGVTASVLTTGTGATPDYLSVSANNTGATTLQVIDDPTGVANNILTSTNQGSNAVFQLNGLPVSQSTNTVNGVVPGMTFNILNTTQPGQTVTLSLQSDPSQLSDALNTFVQNYNSLVDQVNAQVGPSAGLLSGDIMIRTIENDLRQVTTYQGTGSVGSLADLGVTLDATGHMSFDATQINNMAPAQLSAAFSYLGSSTTGFGALAGQLTQLSDPITGLIQTEENGIDTTNAQISAHISTLTDQVTRFQQSTSAQLQQADALAAELANQQTLLNSSLQSLNYVSFGKAPQTS